MEMLRDGLRFLIATVATLLPHRYWERLPGVYPVAAGAFASGLVTFLLGAAIGIPGFLAHMGATVSLANETMLKYDFFNRSLASGFSGLAIFTFLLLTPAGWATMYLLGSGGLRMGAVWFDDPVGDPILTGLEALARRWHGRRQADQQRAARLALEGPELPDRIVSGANAGIAGCDFVIVSSRRKPGWDRGVVVYTATACYRIGDPVERTVAGRLRTLYPLTEHADLEAVRRSVQYDMPDAHPGD